MGIVSDGVIDRANVSKADSGRPPYKSTDGGTNARPARIVGYHGVVGKTEMASGAVGLVGRVG